MSMYWDLANLSYDKSVLEKIVEMDKNNSIPLFPIIYLFYYVIGNLFYGSELYSRQSFIGCEFDFTTSEEIYNITGVYRITFNTHVEEKKSNLFLNYVDDDIISNYLKVYSLYIENYEAFSCPHFHLKDLNNIVLYGNIDILCNYVNLLDACRDSNNYSLLKLALLDDGHKFLKGSLNNELSLESLLSDKILYSNPLFLFHSDLNIDYYIYYYNSSNLLLNLLKTNGIILKRLDILDIYTFSSSADSVIYELLNYVEEINIIITSVCHVFIPDRNLRVLDNFTKYLKQNNISNVKFKYLYCIEETDRYDSMKIFGSYIDDYLDVSDYYSYKSLL